MEGVGILYAYSVYFVAVWNIPIKLFGTYHILASFTKKNLATLH
jgi:hypothetical protein